VDIKVRQTGTAAILDVQGALKRGKAQFLGETIQQVLESGTKNLAINLAEVSELDSSGMGALVRALISVKKAGGKCRFFSATKRIKQTLRMVRLDSVLEMVDDEAAALAGL
jgi:anti-sigma B factor antagonist